MGCAERQIPQAPEGARRQWAADRALRPPMRFRGRLGLGDEASATLPPRGGGRDPLLPPGLWGQRGCHVGAERPYAEEVPCAAGTSLG